MTNKARARAARGERAMEMTVRVTGNNEGKGSKAMAMVTMVAGNRRATATKKVMVTKT